MKFYEIFLLNFSLSHILISFILECWLFSEYIPHYCPFVYLFVLFSKTRICPLPPGAFSIMIIGLMSILTKGEAECITKKQGGECQGDKDM